MGQTVVIREAGGRGWFRKTERTVWPKARAIAQPRGWNSQPPTSSRDRATKRAHALPPASAAHRREPGCACARTAEEWSGERRGCSWKSRGAAASRPAPLQPPRPRPAPFPAGRSEPPWTAQGGQGWVSARGARCTELGGRGLGCGPAECLAGAKGTKWRRGTPFHPLLSPGSGSGEGQGTLLGEGSRGYSGGPWGPLRRPGGGGGQALGLPCGLSSGCERQGTARTPRAERWTGGLRYSLEGRPGPRFLEYLNCEGLAEEPPSQPFIWQVIVIISFSAGFTTLSLHSDSGISSPREVGRERSLHLTNA